MKNSFEMKAGNRLRVLRLVRRSPIARSEIAFQTGLTRAAISLIAGGLQSEGLIFEAGRRESALGRQPTLMQLNPEYAYSLGMTISRVGGEVGVCDLKGQLLCRKPVDIAGATRSEALSAFKKTLKGLLRSYKPDQGRWLGLGISTPGPVNVDSGTILDPPNFDLWRDTPLASEMREIGISQVFLRNNSLSLTAAEQAYGIGRDCQSFVLLVIEDGIGSGLVLGDNLFSGWRGFGYEIGHTSIDQNGPRCSCGLRGCVEIYSSVPNLVASARKHHPHVQTWRDFMDLASAGDRVCERLLQQAVKALGTVTVNVVNMLEPDAVVLTGDILYKGEGLRAEIERFVADTAINRRLRRVPVHLSPLGEHPELMAAAEIAIGKYFLGQLEPQALAAAAARESAAKPAARSQETASLS